MPSTPGKQQIDLIRHRELNALRRMMAQRIQSPAVMTATESPTVAMAAPSPARQTMARIDALEAQMTTMANTTDFANSTAFEANLAAPSSALPKAEQAQIHEAASYFAAHQMVQAQQHLALAIQPTGVRFDHVPTWLALLDLYRATDQAALFDALAMDFSIRFGRSTPSWLSFPNLAKAAFHDEPAYEPAAESATWTSSALIGTSSLQTLIELVTQKTQQKRAVTLDWRDAVAIEPACWELLAQTLQRLADAQIPCTMRGAGQFSLLLNAHTAPAALAQLAWLRCQGDAQAFDDAAIAYCAAYEISPPDWKAPLCKLTLGDDVFLREAAPGAGANGTHTLASELALTGVITERLPLAFAAYTDGSVLPTKAVVVTCARLVRMDPAATLELRLWSSVLHAQGVSITLTQAHRLIAAYWLSQGIYAFAKVTPRTD